MKVWGFILFFLFTSHWSFGQSCDCPTVATCGPCDGGLTSVTIRYTGGAIIGLSVTVSDGGGVIFSGSALSIGSTPFTVTSSAGAGQLFVDDYIRVTGTLLFNEVLATDCSDPVTPGTAYTYFEITGSTDIISGTVCCEPADLPTNPPIMSACPTDITLPADGSCQAIPTWTPPTAINDNCGDSHPAQITSSHNPGDSFGIGTTTVTYTATDDYGNTATCDFDVTVEDDIDPIFTFCDTMKITVTTDGSCSMPVSWTPPVATDNCAVTLTSNYSPGDIFSVGKTTVIYTATDDAGNSETCSFDVQVKVKGGSAILDCPSDIIISAGGSCNAIVSWTPPTANCGLTMTSTHEPGDLFPIGTTEVTYTTTDDEGDTETCTFDVIVSDDTAPTIVCPADQTLSAGGSCVANLPDFTGLAITNDNCPVTVTQLPLPGTSLGLGTTLITLTVSDGAGNTEACTFDVIVNDDTDPTITCPADQTLSADGSCEIVLPDYTGMATANDNCSVSVSQLPLAGSILSIGTTAITLTATDGAGNTEVCMFNLSVNDDTDPALTCPGNQSLSADVNCEALIPDYRALGIVSDNCTANGDITITQVPIAGTTITSSTTVTLTATDEAGNATNCTFDVNITDDSNPSITCPADQVISANISCEALIPDYTSLAVTSDNCSSSGNIVVTQLPAPGTSISGVTAVTLTASDEAGNEATCNFNVTVNDDTDPVFDVCPGDVTVSVDGACQATLLDYTSDATVSDNCPGVSVSQLPVPGTNLSLGATSVTLTATDGEGNTAICTFDVNVIDDTDPAITCPGDQTVLANSNCEAIVPDYTGLGVASDNCTATGNISIVQSPVAGTTISSLTTITLTAEDEQGNTSNCTFDLTLRDETDPVFTGCPLDFIISADGDCATAVSWTPPVVNDNCSTITPTSSHAPGDDFPLGTTTVTYTAIDDAGNTSICSFDVTVNDDTAPVVMNCPSDITVSANNSCKAIVNWTSPVATDNCSSVTMTTNKDSGDLFDIGTTSVSYIATDAAGNTTTCSFDVTVIDDVKPTLNDCPVDIEIEANASCQAIATWTAPTAIDNCPGSVTLVGSHNSGDTFPMGTTLVTYTATDVAGNITTCSFNVIVSDATNPVFVSCPSDITVTADASCQATVNWTMPTATDNCSGPITPSGSHTPGSTFNTGTTTVTYTVTDAAGNSSTCSFDVVVNDDSDPVFNSCPSDIAISANADCETQVSWTLPNATDNCTVILSSTHNPGDIFSVGTTVVTYTATDDQGNTASCSFNVVINDTSDPIITDCPSGIELSANASCEAVATWDLPSVDDCSTTTLTSSFSSGDTFPLGTTTVEYTATDRYGQTATCSFNVVVIDDASPEITSCPGDIEVRANASCEALVTWAEPIARDNCGSVSLTSNFNPGDMFATGITEVVYTATDDRGNSTICSFMVTIQNENVPLITNCPEDVMVDAGESGDVSVDWQEPTAIAACGSVSLRGSHQPGDSFSVGTTEVIYTATDDLGSSVSCSFNVIVVYENIAFDISPVVTPNNDGHNDVWELTNIEKFIDNKVVIVDRWGSEIFSATGYNNEDIAWDGTNLNGKPVPTGTYFYFISVNFASSKVEKRGFIELIR